MTSLASSDLVVRYPGAQATALDRVTMEVPSGGFHSVLGPNGSGKSTLMRALAGVVQPESGEVRVDGRRVGDWRRRELARKLAAVSQAEAIPFPITVRDLVAMGRYPHLGPLRPEGEGDRAAVEEALERCSAHHLRERYVQTLSGGELQRVRIARALAQEPEALLLDEPTASLDIRHAMAIAQLLRESADRGITVLLVTHDLNLAARFSDGLLLLHGGRTAAQGDAWQVLRPEVLRRVYDWTLAVDADPSSGAPRVTPVARMPSGQPSTPLARDPRA